MSRLSVGSVHPLMCYRQRESAAKIFYTLEFSTAQLTGAPGRLSRFDPTDGSLTVLVSTLVTPTSLTRDDASGDLFITEISTGRIIRVRVS
jgi:hypothetical protein